VLFPQLTLSYSLARSLARRPAAWTPASLLGRIQAGLTALVFVLSSLGGVIHEATTSHIRCAQHGELIHGTASVAAVRTEPVAPSARFGSASTAAIHGHEHCALAAATRVSRLLPCPPALGPAPSTATEIATAFPEPTAAHDRALYRTAPKTSPPA
jgi:hypothetical protein